MNLTKKKTGNKPCKNLKITFGISFSPSKDNLVPRVLRKKMYCNDVSKGINL